MIHESMGDANEVGAGAVPPVDGSGPAVLATDKPSHPPSDKPVVGAPSSANAQTETHSTTKQVLTNGDSAPGDVRCASMSGDTSATPTAIHTDVQTEQITASEAAEKGPSAPSIASDGGHAADQRELSSNSDSTASTAIDSQSVENPDTTNTMGDTTGKSPAGVADSTGPPSSQPHAESSAGAVYKKRPREEEDEGNAAVEEDTTTPSDGTEPKRVKTEHPAGEASPEQSVPDSPKKVSEPPSSTFVADTMETPAARRPRTTNQLQWILSKLLKTLVIVPDSWPFRKPVDPVKLNLPTYFSVIKHPMDLSTIRQKIKDQVYWSASECLADFDLMFENCRAFNRPGDDVNKLADKLEAVMQKKLKEMPTVEVETTPVGRGRGKARSVASADGIAPTTPYTPPASHAVPLRRSSTRPVRPPVKDLVSEISPESSVSGKRKNKTKISTRMKFCGTIMRELMHKKHMQYSWPFLKPVDAVALGLTDYHDIIKKPMDLGTVKKKLDAGLYKSAEAFMAEVELVFQNCYKYNAAGSDVAILAKKLHKVYSSKLAVMPEEDPEEELRLAKQNKKSKKANHVSYEDSSDDDSDDEEDSDDEDSSDDSDDDVDSSDDEDVKIAKLKVLLARMEQKKKKKKKSLKNKASKKERKELEKQAKKAAKAAKAAAAAAEAASKVRKAPPKKKSTPSASKASAPAKKKTARRHDSSDESSSSDSDDEGMTYYQKVELCHKVEVLDVEHLNKVVEIIRTREKGMNKNKPKGAEEVIDFSSLQNSTLKALQTYVDSIKGKGKKAGARPPKNHNPVAKRVTQTSKNKAAVAAATPSGEGDAESIGLAGAGGGVAQNTEPISEVVSFGVDRVNSASTNVSASATAEIVPADNPIASADKVEISNASAWLMEEDEEGADAVDEDKSAEFKKFQLLNEQQREREKSEAAAAERLRQEHEEERRRKIAQAEVERLALEQAQAAELKRAADAEAERNAAIMAQRQLERETAKREREAMAGHMDLHEQSEVMESMLQSDDDLDTMMDEM